MAVVIRLGALGLKFGISWQGMGAADGGGNWQASNQINNQLEVESIIEVY